MGLEYQSETELEYAEYFKIYHYDQGIVLLEVDMTKDTARDPEKTSKETSEDTEKEVSKSDKKDSTENKSSKSDAAEEESGDSTSDQNGVSEEELAAELYKGNVVKYLLVPEDVEVPVGLDQDMIIVKMPADKTYVASDEILEQMKELDLLDSVAAVGMEQKACTVPEIAEKMQVNEDEDEADAEVIYGGSFEKPELNMGHMMWGWPLPKFFEGNHIAMGLVQLLLTIAVMVINQKFFISGFKSLWHKAPNMDTLVALGSTASFVYSVYALFAMTNAVQRDKEFDHMKFMKKLLSTMTAAAIGLSMTTALSVGTSVASAADKTAVQMVEDMGLGWNLGNALDSTNTWTSNPSPADIETAWGNVVATENMIKEVKKAGFNTVRIPAATAPQHLVGPPVVLHRRAGGGSRRCVVLPVGGVAVPQVDDGQQHQHRHKQQGGNGVDLRADALFGHAVNGHGQGGLTGSGGKIAAIRN